MTVWTRPAAIAAMLLSLAGASGALAADPAPAETPARQCFWTRDVNGFNAVDDRTVNLRVGVKDVYQLELFSRCPDIDWTEQIAIESRGSTWICSGLDAVLIAPSPIGPQRCMVRSVRKLTPEEVEALHKKAKP
jgi:hypothetical protein